MKWNDPGLISKKTISDKTENSMTLTGSKFYPKTTVNFNTTTDKKQLNKKISDPGNGFTPRTKNLKK